MNFSYAEYHHEYSHKTFYDKSLKKNLHIFFNEKQIT